MALVRFKYQINHYLSIQPRYVTVDGIRKLLEMRYGIAQETFNRDRFLAPDDADEIPQQRLEAYATVLQVSMLQLTQACEPDMEYSCIRDNPLR